MDVLRELVAKWRAMGPSGFYDPDDRACAMQDARDDCADELEAAIQSMPPAEGGWMPIMTAPHGTMILVADMEAREARHWAFVGWRHFQSAPQCVSTPGRENRPATHWQPLPQPPVAAHRAAGDSND